MGNTVKFGDWISRGFDLLRKDWGTWALMGSLYFGPLVVALIMLYASIFALPFLGKHMDPDVALPGMVMFGLLVLGIGLFMLFLLPGMYLTARKQLKGESISVSDAFSGGGHFFTVLVICLVYVFAACIGFVFCVFPAFIVGGFFYLAIPIAVYEGLGPMEAIQKSFSIAKKDWLMFTLFALVAQIIAQVGLYACYIPIVFSIGLQFTFAAVAYEDCVNPAAANDAPTFTGAVKYCTTCGKQLRSETNFCDNCGAAQV